MKYWFAALLWLASAVSGWTQRQLSEQATVSLWTVGTGSELYAAWGHSALRFQDPVEGIDWVFNYGTFDFNTPNFYLKFIQGDLDYLLSLGIAPEIFEEYRDQTHQLVVEQELNFTPAETQHLLQLLETNLLPENVAYHYDFVRDNCSTRIRDIVARAVPVRWAEHAERQTLRQILDPYVADLPAILNGIDLLFTSAVDRPPDSHEKIFLPQTMEVGFAEASIIEGGKERPLVRATRILNPGLRFPPKVFDFVPVLFWLLAAVAFAAEFGRWKWFRWIDLPLFTVIGLVGVLLVFLWFGSRHWVLHGNWNLLWAWPTHVLIWFCPKAFRKFYWRFCAAAMFLLVPLYFFPPQYFPAFVPPLLLLLGARAWTRSRT